MKLIPEGKRKSLSSQKHIFRYMAWLISCMVSPILEITNFLQYVIYLLYILASIYLHGQTKKNFLFCFNISAFYFYFGLLQIPPVWHTMNKCSPSSWYTWFSYGCKFSLSQSGNFHACHDSSDRSHTILLIFSVVFCCTFSYPISLSEVELPWLHVVFSSLHNKNLENIFYYTTVCSASLLRIVLHIF